MFGIKDMTANNFMTGGLLTNTQSRYKKSRLGDLLVRRGKLSQMQLDAALKGQKETGQQLGDYLCSQGLISQSDLKKTLAQQFAYRALALSFTFCLSVSSMVQPKSARAEDNTRLAQITYNYDRATTQKSVTNKRSDDLRMASIQTVPRGLSQPQHATPSKQHSQKIFGSYERKSTNLSAFTKWNTVLSNLDNGGMGRIPQELMQYQSASKMAKINAVNSYVNRVTYIEDQTNWGNSDYWATPAEFMARGGDCEDFAIAKFAMLKRLGVSEHNMRLAIVQDLEKNIPHAVLIVYTESGPVMLDNQIKTVQRVGASFNRYEPIYSINRNAWWRHTT